jgi:hypothetical protein
VYRPSGGTHCLQVRIEEQAKQETSKKQNERETNRKELTACFLLVSILNVEATLSFERSVDFYQTTPCYNPEDLALHR